MAQITWKNIDAPSFRDALLANNSASQLIGGALDSLTQVANNFKQNNEANWENQARLNTEDILSSIRGIQGLNDFHAQKGNFDPAMLRDRYGAQVNGDQIQLALANRLKELQNETVMGASNAGVDAANQQQSIAAGLDTARQALIAGGLKDPAVMSAALANITNNDMVGTKLKMEEQQDQILSQGLQHLVQGAGNLGAVPALNGPIDINHPLVESVIAVESSGNPNAKNGKSSAAGLMQLTDAAQKDVGVTDPFNPDQNRRGGTEFLNRKLQEFNYDIPSALMAYKMGSGGYRKWLASGADPNSLSAEDREYVGKVMSHYQQRQGSAAGMPKANAATMQTLLQAQDAALQRDVTRENLHSAQDRRKKESNISTALQKGMQVLESTGDIREARRVMKDLPHGVEAGALFEQYAAPHLKLTPEEESTLATAGSVIDQAVQTQANVDNALIASLQKELSAQDNLSGSKELFDEIGGSTGGLAEVIRSKAGTPGWLDRLVPGIEKGNGIIDTIASLERKFIDNGASPEQATRLVIQTLRRIGGLRGGSWGTTGIDSSELKDAIPYAIKQEAKIAKIKNKVTQATIEAMRNLTRSKAESSVFANELKQQMYKSRFNGKKFEIPQNIQDYVQKRLAVNKIDPSKLVDPDEQTYQNLLDIYQDTGDSDNAVTLNGIKNRLYQGEKSYGRF